MRESFDAPVAGARRRKRGRHLRSNPVCYSDALNPKSGTFHSSLPHPCTLLSHPYSLHPKPAHFTLPSLIPTPYSLTPTPYIKNPALSTLTPKQSLGQVHEDAKEATRLYEQALELEPDHANTLTPTPVSLAPTPVSLTHTSVSLTPTLAAGARRRKRGREAVREGARAQPCQHPLQLRECSRIGCPDPQLNTR